MSLRFVGLHTKSLRSYKRALLHFFRWLDDEGEPIPSRPSILDDLLAQYLEHLWLDDINITYAGHVLSASTEVQAARGKTILFQLEKCACPPAGRSHAC